MMEGLTRGLFLDFDGVLNSTQSTLMYWRRHGRTTIFTDERYLCPIACSNLTYLMETIPDLRIVVSSSWRLHNNLSELRSILYMACEITPDKILGVTPRLPYDPVTKHSPPRGEEIQAWLNENQTKTSMTDFMILDDDSDMAHLAKDHFLQTDSDVGLTIKDCRAVIQRLAPELSNDKKALW
jgi:hypothetical protein